MTTPNTEVTKTMPIGIIEQEAAPLSLLEIYNQVLANSEIILTIPAAEEHALRTGLAGVKAKQNAKLKASGLQPDTSTLSYNVTPSKASEGAIDVHIVLSKKQTITVLSVRLPDDEI